MMYSKLPRDKHERDDGWLVELVSSNFEDIPLANFHSYLVMIKPHRFRAMHYHKEKEEWLALTSGRIKLTLENIFTKERKDILLDEGLKEYYLIYIPPMTAHIILNIGKRNASVVVFSKTSEIPGDTVHYEMEVGYNG